jgi:hypothetical protein
MHIFAKSPGADNHAFIPTVAALCGQNSDVQAVLSKGNHPIPTQLTPCCYLSIHCQQHQEMRLAVEWEPTAPRHPCPQCYAPCSYVMLGQGCTRRCLPFFDQWKGLDPTKLR